MIKLLRKLGHKYPESKLVDILLRVIFYINEKPISKRLKGDLGSDSFR